jgi:hypothetical protein
MHATVTGGLNVAGLLYADELAMESFTSYGLQEKMDLLDK